MIAKLNNSIKRLLPYTSVPVLVYHQITNPKSGEDFQEDGIPQSQFEAQMKYLFERRFETITLDAIIEGKASNHDLYKRRVAITFDDGYLDNYKYAFPSCRSIILGRQFLLLLIASGKSATGEKDNLSD